MTLPAIGTQAPAFDLPRDGGGRISLAALRPGKVVLFFYPQDSTPTCTVEAKDFTALAADFAAAGTTVIGISRDSVARHDRFLAKSELAVILGSDEDGAVCEAYGVWAEKKTFGKTYMGIKRTTFLIDGEGRIAQVWDVARVKDHATEVLAAAVAL